MNPFHTTRALATVLLSLPLACGSTFAGSPEAAQYRVTFTGLWTPATHPTDYPGNAHFSALIGGTHAEPNLLWLPGGIATNGIEVMAETGSKNALRNEVLAHVASGDAGEVIESASGTDALGTMVDEFTVTQAFPYATVVTMIAPSPDWFVGTHDLSLFVDGEWVEEVVLLLQPYDSGTDSGITYTSSNADTSPPEPIVELIGYPVSAEDVPALPFGEMRFTRLVPPICHADIDHSGAVDGADLTTLLGAWGSTNAAADITGDGGVDGSDLAVLLASWGTCR